MLNIYCNTKEKRLVRVGDKVVGRLEGNRFVKLVFGSKHRLRCPPAWAIDAEAFDNEVKPNATEIVVVDKESDTKWKISVETFDRHKFTLNRGFGLQYACVLAIWQVIEPNGNKPLQLTLWGDSDG